ncbi:hypothetical protein PtA15_6A440 [Puccinia triticina]|uniref:Uncharacterized protein n=1 Tax=Puccinia triticina TaxID=208348 RepID=A0ABY7CNW0_9BASI|nr:uncharacterized protein PtA15_6A440 [Puccinia triticina]WAQ85811.1 hypothetical protein PtA15_6A440 [Puccinia triticina]
MADTLALLSRVHSQLVRTSNDQIRDLTEVLICFSKLQRSQKDHPHPASRGSGDDNTTRGSLPAEIYRSGSRASHRFSHSHSPSKLRHTIDLSPLSAISSHDDSPLSRAKPAEPLRPNTRSATACGPHHQRASTISFTHHRELSFDGLPVQHVRAKNRMSATSIRRIGPALYGPGPSNPHHASSSSRRPGEEGVEVDEFGLVRRPSMLALRPDPHPRPESAWSRPDTATTSVRRGSAHSAAGFPKTPPRLPTSSLSQTTALSNVSPTNPARGSVDGPRRLLAAAGGLDTGARPPSSMGRILGRANGVLARVDRYPSSVALSRIGLRSRHDLPHLPSEAEDDFEDDDLRSGADRRRCRPGRAPDASPTPDAYRRPSDSSTLGAVPARFPRRSSPRRSSPRRSSPRRTSPRRTSPRRTSPVDGHRTRPRKASFQALFGGLRRSSSSIAALNKK